MPEPFLIILVFVVGIVSGSFLNVLVPRLYTKDFLFGRSKCLKCKKKLKWYELIPILSYIFQKGKCRSCRKYISISYPIIELVTGLFFVYLLFAVSDPIKLFFSFAIAIPLIGIFVYDIQHKLIPDFLTIIFAIFSLIYILITDPVPSFFAGIIFAAPFFLLWFVSKGKWMGFGDVKLALPVGFFAGISDIVSVFVLSFVIGAIFSLFVIVAQGIFGKKKWGMKTEIPFAPFIISGFILTTFVGIDIYEILSAILSI